jgi:hypothetical protein
MQRSGEGRAGIWASPGRKAGLTVSSADGREAHDTRISAGAARAETPMARDPVNLHSYGE